MATLKLAQAALAPAHWVRLSLSLLAHGPLVEAMKYPEAAELLRTWCDTWRSTFGFAVLRGAWRMEQAGHLFAACGAKAEAVEALLVARSDLARLSVPNGTQHSDEIEAKLKEVLGS